ncbi:MAG: ATP-dependent RNA helicase HrpA [Syntrophales bacterium]
MLDIHALITGIRKRLNAAMISDQYMISRELRNIEIEKASGIAPNGERDAKRLAKLERILNASIRRRIVRKSAVPRLSFPEALPITSKKEEITEAIRRNQVLIISGETGSGKSTQIPKMCLAAGRGTGGLIGHTQPRRIAAVAVANRIAEELGEETGKSVSYRIRFEETGGRNSYIKVMTDGILLSEVQADPCLSSYDTIIIDEAHERNLNIDFLLGILRSLLRSRRDLKVIITSATIDTEKFSQAFNGAPVVEVSGRMYPVEVRYLSVDTDADDPGELTYIDEAVHAVEKIERESPDGDILIFMPTEQDIRETCEILEGRTHSGNIILPLFARLTRAAQHKVFSPCSKRKIIVATNVAETSITIPGIRYVVDTGLARISRYNPRTRTLNLPVTEISRSSADQRKGRCGRVRNGVCIRLYTEADYEGRPLFTPPEILRSNLAEVILRMLSLKIDDIPAFPFVDPPEAKSVRDGFEILKELGAIRPGKGGRHVLSGMGRMMARLPLDPRISRMLLEAARENCLKEVVVIAAALSIQDPRERPSGKTTDARIAHESLRDMSSDFLTLLNIWTGFHAAAGNSGTRGGMRKFCRDHYLSYRRMREWVDVHEQITGILKEAGIMSDTGENPPASYASIHKSILSGYLSNIALKKEKNFYTAAKGRQVMLFPGSAIFNRGGDWIVAAEMVETSRPFARTAAIIDPGWIEPLAGHLCRYSYSSPRWDNRRGEVVALEQPSLHGLAIAPARPVSYARIDPGKSSEIFIQSALVEGDVERPLPFLTHNLEQIEKIKAMEEKMRRRDLLVGESEIRDFYARRIEGACDLRTLRKLIRDRGSDQFLRMTERDLLRRNPDKELMSHFPDQFVSGKIRLPLKYIFEPGKPQDGVTLEIPYSLTAAVADESVDWMVPGLLREKITLLIKGLPKMYRKRLVPLADTVETVLTAMPRGGASLLSALGKFIHQKFGVDIPAQAWSPEKLPDYLKMRFSVVDSGGQELCSGRDIRVLREKISGQIESHAFSSAKEAWERSGLTKWDFGDLPERIVLERDGRPEGFAYPALVPADGCADIRLLGNQREAEALHRRGVMQLYSLHFRKELKILKRQLLLDVEMKKWAVYFGGEKQLKESLLNRTIRGLFDLPIRSEREFFSYAESASSAVFPKGREVLEEVKPVLKAFAQTREFLHRMEAGHRTNKTALKFLSEMREALEKLVPADFANRYESSRLIHLPRLLNALNVRIRSGLDHIERDREKSLKVIPFENRLRRLEETLADDASLEKRKAIDDFRWMIEEYRVSVFAQKLKTAFPVSPKRMEERLREIERMT